MYPLRAGLRVAPVERVARLVDPALVRFLSISTITWSALDGADSLHDLRVSDEAGEHGDERKGDAPHITIITSTLSTSPELAESMAALSAAIASFE